MMPFYRILSSLASCYYRYFYLAEPGEVRITPHRAGPSYLFYSFILREKQKQQRSSAGKLRRQRCRAARCDLRAGHAPQGTLPFELPSSMEAVRKQLSDVPYDSEQPLFPFGSGLSY